MVILNPAGPLVREEPVQAFRNQIQVLLAEGTRSFAINLASVPYIDSYGLGGLAAAYKSIREAGGAVIFLAAQERVIRTLKRTHLDQVFELFEDEASASSSF
jgi:anti-anti-sigma factor